MDHALATSSGTSALFVCLSAMGLKPGDEVIVPAYTFVASYTAIIFAGLVPVLAEIDESLTLDPEGYRASHNAENQGYYARTHVGQSVQYGGDYGNRR